MKKKIMALLLVTYLMFGFGFLYLLKEDVYAQKIEYIDNNNYSKNSIIVVLDENISEINKVHNKDFLVISK